MNELSGDRGWDMVASGGQSRTDQYRASLFTRPRAYQLVLAIRAVATDAGAAGLFLAAALCWEARFNHAGGLVIIPPAAIASVVFTVGLRIGRAPGALANPDRRLQNSIALYIGGTPGAGAISGRRKALNAALYIGAALLAVFALQRCPGGLAACYVPFLAAVIVPWRWRRWRKRHNVRQVRRPTVAGFRPSWRAVLSPRGWVALGNVDVAYPRESFIKTNLGDTETDASAALFRLRRDVRSEAYCQARAVEYLLGRNRIVEAESRLQSAVEDSVIYGEPAIMAVRAQFLAAVGQHSEALDSLVQARDQCRRPPAGLQVLILHAAITSGRYHDSGQWRWSEWRRVSMVWRRQAAGVILELAAKVRVRALADQDGALELAYQICRLPDRLISQLPHLDFGLADYEQARSAKGMVLDTVAEIYARRGEYVDAASAFMDAHQEFASMKDRPRAGRSLVRAYASALAGGYVEPAQESHALDMIRVGLQILEEDRGALHGEDSRANWIVSQRELYATIFARLTEVRYHPGKSGELGLWLLESLHRSMTADLMFAQDAVQADAALLAALADLGCQESDVLLAGIADPNAVRQAAADLAPARKQVMSQFGGTREAAFLAESTDVGAVLRRLGDRNAIIYHCWRDEDGWVIHGVLVSGQHAMRIHQTRLDATPASEDVARWMTPAGALDVLDEGDGELAEWLFSTSLADELWNEIAQALLPSSWRDVLCQADGAGPTDLLIVPDGPIGSLPLAALPVKDGMPLVDFAAVALVPALSMLGLPDGQHDRVPGTAPTAVVHLDDRKNGLAQVVREAEHWRAAAQRMQVIETADQASLEAALNGRSRPDITAISTHGTSGAALGDPASRAFGTTVYLRDGSVLSAEAALRLSWPATVILGACWVSAATLQAGREPFSFPLACLLRGASTVIGGVAPIPDDETADVLCRIIDDLDRTADALSLLRGAQRSMRRHGPVSGLSVVQVAGLTCWTTAAARRPADIAGMPLHWTLQGLPSDGAPLPARLAPYDAFSEAMQLVLAHASYLARDRPVGTLEFLAATFTADSADWTGFAVACEIGEPPLPGSMDDDVGGTAIIPGEQSVTITLPLAAAIHCGQIAARRLHDENVLPAHVILAALADKDTAAARWLDSYKRQAAAEWPRHLGDRILRIDLRDNGGLAGLLLDVPPGAPAQVHNKSMTGAAGNGRKPRSARLANWWTPALTALVIIGLPGVFGPVSQPQVSQPQVSPPAARHNGPSAIGVVLSPSTVPGALIRTVLPGSPASRAGLHVGDVIISVAGTPVRSVTATGQAIHAHPPGQRVFLTILRVTHRMSISVTLATPEVMNDPGYLGYEALNGSRGALITNVAPASPAATAGLRPGDIVTAVSGYADGGSSTGLLLLIETHHPGETISLTIVRNGQTMTIKATLSRSPS
jgi:CHAT domain/PDZ domain/Clp amino terminal domain, pathogenicity island component